MVGCRLKRRSQGQGLDRTDLGLVGADRGPSPTPQEGLGAQRYPARADRLVEVWLAAARLSGAAAPVGGGANIRVARPEPPLTQRLWRLLPDNATTNLL